MGYSQRLIFISGFLSGSLMTLVNITPLFPAPISRLNKIDRRSNDMLSSSQCQSNVTIWVLGERRPLGGINLNRDCSCRCKQGVLPTENADEWVDLGLQRGDAILDVFNVPIEVMKLYRATADSIGAKLVELVGTEAPVCRRVVPFAGCHLMDHHISMRPNDLIRTSRTNIGMSPSWYSRPRFPDTLPRAVAFISKPCYDEWKNYRNTEKHPGYQFGRTTRGYWLFELQKYFPVDVYSLKCGIILPSERTMKRSAMDNDLAMAAKVAVTSRYRFALALENKRSPGYVTEKLYQAFEARTLPIYNGDDYAYKIRPGDNSFLHVDDYYSAEKLADYLWYLVNNTDEYDRYFDWKKYPLRREFLTSFAESVLITPNISQRSSDELKGWLHLKESLKQDPGWESYSIDAYVDEYIAAMYSSAKTDPRVEFDLPEFKPWQCRFCEKLSAMVPRETGGLE